MPPVWCAAPLSFFLEVLAIYIYRRLPVYVVEYEVDCLWLNMTCNYAEHDQLSAPFVLLTLLRRRLEFRCRVPGKDYGESLCIS